MAWQGVTEYAESRKIIVLPDGGRNKWKLTKTWKERKSRKQMLTVSELYCGLMMEQLFIMTPLTVDILHMNWQKARNDMAMMTLPELQGVLGDRIRVTLKEGMTTEEREIENAQSALVVEMAKQMINNGDLILRTEKLASMNRALEDSVAMKLIYGDGKVE